MRSANSSQVSYISRVGLTILGKVIMPLWTGMLRSISLTLIGSCPLAAFRRHAHVGYPRHVEPLAWPRRGPIPPVLRCVVAWLLRPRVDRGHAAPPTTARAARRARRAYGEPSHWSRTWSL